MSPYVDNPNDRLMGITTPDELNLTLLLLNGKAIDMERELVLSEIVSWNYCKTFTCQVLVFQSTGLCVANVITFQSYWFYLGAFAIFTIIYVHSNFDQD